MIEFSLLLGGYAIAVSLSIFVGYIQYYMACCKGAEWMGIGERTTWVCIGFIFHAIIWIGALSITGVIVWV
jgi:hypothetical protein